MQDGRTDVEAGSLAKKLPFGRRISWEPEGGREGGGAVMISPVNFLKNAAHFHVNPSDAIRDEVELRKCARRKMGRR